MRFVAAAACVIVALDGAGKATGDISQSLFSPEHIWAWWLVAAAWGFYAIILATRGAR